MSRPLRRHQWPKLVLINGKSEATFLLYYFVFVHVSFFGKVLENSQYIWFPIPGMITIWARLWQLPVPTKIHTVHYCRGFRGPCAGKAPRLTKKLRNVSTRVD